VGNRFYLLFIFYIGGNKMRTRQNELRTELFNVEPSKSLVYNESTNMVTLDANNFDTEVFSDANIFHFQIGKLLLDFVSIDYSEIMSFTDATLGTERPSMKRLHDISGLLPEYSQKLRKMHIYFYPFGYNAIQHDLLYTASDLTNDDKPYRMNDYSNIFDSISEGIDHFSKTHSLFCELVNFCFFSKKYPKLTPTQRFYIYSKLNNFEHPYMSLRYNLGSSEFGNGASNEQNVLIIEQQAQDESVKLQETYRGGVFGLLYFEFIKLLSKGAQVSKCKNCGKFFLVTGRSDTVYCEECKSVGPGNTYRKKVNEDPIMKLHQRAYKRYHQKVSRKSITQQAFLEWLEQAKSMRKQAQDHDISFDKYREWIEK
jgi:hypothetical protein